MKSVWCGEVKKPEFSALDNDIKTDVLIIGGGITGILCGYMLKNNGVNCVITEANTICSGVTQNTTAKITYQHGAIFDKMVKRFGIETSTLYIKAQTEAINKYREICKNIECDFKEQSSYVYSLNNKEKIEKEVLALNKIGVNAEFNEKTALPFEIAGAVCVKNQAEFNPLKFLYSISKEINIFENTKVIELLPDGAITEKGKIKAEKIIVATHFPFVNKYGGYFLKMYQHRSYVLGLKNAANVGGMYVDEAENGLSFRNYKDLLLLGGGGHRTGQKGGNWQVLREFAAKYYPDSEEKYYWATQDCKTLDDIPYIGRYAKSTPNIYVATGFNKWGMTNAMTAAAVLTDLITDKENEFSTVFNPQRTVLRPRLAENTIHSAIGLLTPTVPRCPHLGCALKYNPQEHSWDCPCHGSRFNKDGKLLDNPATEDKQFK